MLSQSHPMKTLEAEANDRRVMETSLGVSPVKLDPTQALHRSDFHDKASLINNAGVPDVIIDTNGETSKCISCKWKILSIVSWCITSILLAALIAVLVKSPSRLNPGK